MDFNTYYAWCRTPLIKLPLCVMTYTVALVVAVVLNFHVCIQTHWCWVALAVSHCRHHLCYCKASRGSNVLCGWAATVYSLLVDE